MILVILDDPNTTSYPRVVSMDGTFNYLVIQDMDIVSDTWFEYAEPFAAGYGIVKKAGLFYIINQHGEKVTKAGYDLIKPLSCNYFLAKTKDRFVFLGKQGKPVKTYKHAESFCNGYAPVLEDGAYYYVNTKFEKVFGPFEYASYPVANGICGIVKKDGKQDVILLQ